MIYEVYNAIFNGVFGTTGCENGVDREQKGCGGGVGDTITSYIQIRNNSTFSRFINKGGPNPKGGAKSSGIALMVRRVSIRPRLSCPPHIKLPVNLDLESNVSD